jgi:hypothetical protein
MQYWTKNGSIPSTETDGTEGWQPAPEPPTDVPTDKELVWLNWEWLIRDPKPADRAGWQWNWQHESRTWVESAWQTELQPIEAIELPEIVVTTQLSGFTTTQISEIS